MLDMVMASSRMSKAAWNSFVACLREAGCEMYEMAVYDRQGGVLRAALPPYALDDRPELYSLSKSFCAAAIGFLVDEGKASLRQHRNEFAKYDTEG